MTTMAQLVLTQLADGWRLGAETIEQSALESVPVSAVSIQFASARVLGRITATGKLGPFDPTATDGRATVACIVLSPPLSR